MCGAQKQEDIPQPLHEAVIKKGVLPFVGWKTQSVVSLIYPQWFLQPAPSQNNHKAKCPPP